MSIHVIPIWLPLCIHLVPVQTLLTQLPGPGLRVHKPTTLVLASTCYVTATLFFCFSRLFLCRFGHCLICLIRCLIIPQMWQHPSFRGTPPGKFGHRMSTQEMWHTEQAAFERASQNVRFLKSVSSWLVFVMHLLRSLSSLKESSTAMNQLPSLLKPYQKGLLSDAHDMLLQVELFRIKLEEAEPQLSDNRNLETTFTEHCLQIINVHIKPRVAVIYPAFVPLLEANYQCQHEIMCCSHAPCFHWVQLLENNSCMCGKEPRHSTPHHLQTNGLSKWTNWTLVNMLSMYVVFNHRNCDILSFIRKAFNTAQHETTSYSSYFLLYVWLLCT